MNEDAKTTAEPAKEPCCHNDPEQATSGFLHVEGLNGLAGVGAGGTCPRCGYCPCCGRGGYDRYWGRPYPWGHYPTIWC